MIKCPNCEGELKYNPGDTIIKCEHCGSKWNPDELTVKFKFAQENKNIEQIDAKSYSCTQCGSRLLTFDDTAVTFCSYCGSQAIIEDRMVKINKPYFIIPFSLSKEECIKAYKKEISKYYFVPNYMKSDIEVEKFRGIYMPYCIYRYEYKGKCINKGKKYLYRDGDIVKYELYDIEADIDAYCDGISFDLSSNYFDNYSHSMLYDFKKVKKYNPNYLLGYYADVADVSYDIYDDRAKNIIDNESKKVLRKIDEYSLCGCSEPKLDMNLVSKKIGMFPVYFLAIKNKKRDKVYYAVVNGQTGQVATDIPIDFRKYILRSLIITPFVFLILKILFLDIFKYFDGILLTFFSFSFALLCIFIILYQSIEIGKKYTHSDDLGFTSIKKKSINKLKDISLVKCVIAIIIPILLLIIDPINDYYSYIASLISFFFILWSFNDIVKGHNMLICSKLPQLNKRGGDECE